MEDAVRSKIWKAVRLNRDMATETPQTLRSERERKHLHYSFSFCLCDSVALWLIQFGYDGKRENITRNESTSDHP
jgi:hypothetical protein